MERKMTIAEMADMLRQDPWFTEHVAIDMTFYEPPDNKADKTESEGKTK